MLCSSLFAIVVLLTFAAPPASAQFWRSHELTTLDGEPTDPDGALAVLNEAALDLEGYGLAPAEPTSQAESDSWWDAILNLLFSLGLISGDAD
ncbi:MAG: hypothetical protein DHS20C21_07430 [Gemmatimonadota bacterium]|nr:MAG: hypothetical protein DHS20C21_07430 [Gemmatimonadota bacterium]